MNNNSNISNCNLPIGFDDLDCILTGMHGGDLIVVGGRPGMGKSDSRQQEISDISRSLKTLAKELNVPVIALSQMSHQVEERRNHRPMLSDLRECRAIEQDADVIMFIYRDDYYNSDITTYSNTAEIIVAKNANGDIGTVKLGFAEGRFI